jgi:GNAT superfamily N-acetyltransferase
VEIVGLTKRNLEQAVNLVEKIFPSEYEEEAGKDELPASLNPDAYRDYLERTGITPGLKYWVAVEKGRVIGSVGLYCYKEDQGEADWLGWFCVDEDFRCKGTGTKLLLFAINEAKKHGKEYLRLYTTDDEDELDSHRLYEKYGFKVIETKPWTGRPELNLTEFIYELNLKAQT